MTSGTIRSVPIEMITIEDRQRDDLGDIDALAHSLSRNGQINPIVITPENKLVAGERRLTAAKQLGWTNILVHLTTDLSLTQLHLIELEENIRRKDLEWKEQCNAIVDYHKLMCEEDPSWDVNKTSEALNKSPRNIQHNLAIAKALEDKNALVMNADKFSVARGIVTRNAERARENNLSDLNKLIAEDAPPVPIDPDVPPLPDPDPVREVPLLCADFREWLKTAPKKQTGFNFIHCDFPYGIDANKHDGGAADKFGGYEDTKEIYFELLAFFCENIEKIAAPSAHIMFWFSMDYYNETLSTLTRAGLAVNPFPLVWYRSDNSGILPDPKRGPRRNYETALLCSRRDRPIVQAVSNVSAQPNTKEIHMSEKPKDVLRHFFRMFVDEHSTVFDPTAGSANALKVAEEMGAKSVFGLERDPEYHKLATETWDA